MRYALPTENPVCVHHWIPLVTSHQWECTRCGYRIAEIERHQPTEGETITVMCDRPKYVGMISDIEEP